MSLRNRDARLHRQIGQLLIVSSPATPLHKSLTGSPNPQSERNMLRQRDVHARVIFMAGGYVLDTKPAIKCKERTPRQLSAALTGSKA